jgi:hypothetical protein
MNEVKKIIEESDIKNNKNEKEITNLNIKIEELNNIILQQKEDNKQILTYFEQYKTERENELLTLNNENSEMKKELQFLVIEYEKLQKENQKYQEGLMKFNQFMNV